MIRPGRTLLPVGLLALAVSGCTGSSSSAPATTPAAGSSATTSAAPATSSDEPYTPGPSDVDLPAPAEPSTPAASTAGSLSLTSIPVPDGWKAVAAKGGAEDGYLGNGTPAHARDARYAAYEVMSVGCSPVTRSAWTDPTSALEVNLAKDARTGVADAMVFDSAAHAQVWFGLFRKQLEACQKSTDPAVQQVASDATGWLGRRRYATGESWSEVAAVTGTTVRLYLLMDPDATVTRAQQQALLAQVRAAR